MKTIATLLLALLSMTSSFAESISKDLILVPHNVAPDVTLTLDLHARASHKDAFTVTSDTDLTVKFKEFVTFSYSASQDGYVSLWNIGSSGKAMRLLPNRFQTDMKVKAGKHYFLGEQRQKFGIRVDGPEGMEEVFLLWTKKSHDQPINMPDTTLNASAVHDMGDILKVAKLDTDDWSSKRLSFDVSADGKPLMLDFDDLKKQADSRLRMTGAEGKVYLLSMGANTGQLQKAGSDAINFNKAIKSLFKGVRSKLYSDAHVSDFRRGMNWLKQQAGPKDTIIIYYSGHGSTLRDQDDDEKRDRFDEVFVMADARKTKAPGEAHVIRDDEFSRRINQLQTNNLIVVLDACFSAGMTKSGLGASQGRRKFFSGGSLGMFLAALTPNWFSDRDRLNRGVLIYAAEENQSAYEGFQGGMMTSALLSEMFNKNNRGKSWYNMVQATGNKVNRLVRVKPAMLGDASLLKRIRLAR